MIGTRCSGDNMRGLQVADITGGDKSYKMYYVNFGFFLAWRPEGGGAGVVAI
jgi:hypothetical protein